MSKSKSKDTKSKAEDIELSSQSGEDSSIIEEQGNSYELALSKLSKTQVAVNISVPILAGIIAKSIAEASYQTSEESSEADQSTAAFVAGISEGLATTLAAMITQRLSGSAKGPLTGQLLGAVPILGASTGLSSSTNLLYQAWPNGFSKAVNYILPAGLPAFFSNRATKIARRAGELNQLAKAFDIEAGGEPVAVLKQN